MPVFSTPDPISVLLDLPAGDVHIDARHRRETVVTMHSDCGGPPPEVVFAKGRLVINGSAADADDCDGTVDLEIQLPAGSSIEGVTREGGFRGVGRLGTCALRTDHGEIELDETGPITLATDSGDITVARVTGHAEIASKSGEIQIDRIDGTAHLANEYGGTEIGNVTGDLWLHARDADIVVGRAHGNVDARSDSGDIRISEVDQGSVLAVSDAGNIEIGVAESSSALLDLKSLNGRVNNSISVAVVPEQTGRGVEIQARSHHGDININPLGLHRVRCSHR